MVRRCSSKAEAKRYRVQSFGGAKAQAKGWNLDRKNLTGKFLTLCLQHCTRRPILLIGHCYGGLVLQQVYLQSQRRLIDYPGIYNSITGMIFLGTPHYGADMSLGEIYETIRKESLQIEDGLLKTIEHDNTVLVDTVADFTREIKLRTAAPEIFCFFEERTTPIGRLANLKNHPRVFVVNESSGTLPGYEKLGLTVDHFNMNKFDSGKNNHYASIVEVMQTMAEKSEHLMEQRIAARRDTSPASSDPEAQKAKKKIRRLIYSAIAAVQGILYPVLYFLKP